MKAEQDLDHAVSDQLVQREQFLIGLEDRAGIVALDARSSFQRISQRVMKRSTAVGKLTLNTP